MTDDRQQRPTTSLAESAASWVRRMSPETDLVDLASWDGIRKRMVLPNRRARSRSRRWLSWTVPALAACLMLVIVGRRWVRPVAVTVDGGRLAEDGEVLSWGRAPSTLRFSDGTQATLSPGAQVRVAERTRLGARFVLGDGALGLAVVHTGRADWRVDAGPYEVVVTGTKFDVRWSRRDETFSLRLREGSVVVRGGLAGDGVRLRAGQRLETSGVTRSLEIADDSARPADTANAPAAVVAPPAAAVVPPTRVALDAARGASASTGSAPLVPPRRISPPRRVALRDPDKGAAPVRAVPTLSPQATLPPRLETPVAPHALPATPSAPIKAPVSTTPTPPAATAFPPRVDPSPPPRMQAGGIGCDQRAQFQFEDSIEQFVTPGCCSLAFSSLALDRDHSYCGRGSLRAEASFDLQGKPSFTGFPPHQTGEVKVRINPPQNFTEKTVTARVFVEAPLGVRFTAVLYAVSGSIYVPGGATSACSPNQWCTLRHTFHERNALPSGETVPVDRVSQFAFQIKSVGNVTAWSGRVYLDDIRWE